MDKRLTGPELVKYLRDNPTSDAMRAASDEIERLREALRWAAGSLLAACGSGQATELDRFTLDGVTRTGTEILDMADAALAQEQEEA